MGTLSLAGLALFLFCLFLPGKIVAYELDLLAILQMLQLILQYLPCVAVTMQLIPLQVLYILAMKCSSKLE